MVYSFLGSKPPVHGQSVHNRLYTARGLDLCSKEPSNVSTSRRVDVLRDDRSHHVIAIYSHDSHDSHDSHSLEKAQPACLLLFNEAVEFQ